MTGKQDSLCILTYRTDGLLKKANMTIGNHNEILSVTQTGNYNVHWKHQEERFGEREGLNGVF